jgi:hypothetical protein
MARLSVAGLPEDKTSYRELYSAHGQVQLPSSKQRACRAWRFENDRLATQIAHVSLRKSISAHSDNAIRTRLVWCKPLRGAARFRADARHESAAKEPLIAGIALLITALWLDGI